MRADAERNHSRIVEIARDALAADPAATMQSIAVAAGVGQGTLYRRFPSREALLAAVYRTDFDALVGLAHALLGRMPPLRALRAWFDELARFGRAKHELSHVLDAVTRAELHDEQYDRILAAIDELVAAGKANGELRSDIEPDEVLPLLSFLWNVDSPSPERTSHLLDLVVDGLRPPRHAA